MGYWEEKAQYEFLKGLTLITNCSWCGVGVKQGEGIVCQAGHNWIAKGKYLCKGCASKCAKCKRYYCPRHINTHTVDGFVCGNKNINPLLYKKR